MWQRILIRELLPFLPRLLRLVPMLEKNFMGERFEAQNPSAFADFILELQAQIAQIVAEGRRERLELQSRLESAQQELRMLRAQSELIEKHLNQLQHRTRLLFILNCILAGSSAVVVVLLAVLMARISH